ncbi:unnamed protein product [Schistosoma rodhaini]|uniref:Vesicle transport protein GOT1B n=1 Tax=Schistosoma rodhaini TaxID=6188 RepID=A0AA85FXX8_9TREM|nr:unnamed protein product [Schistosoma rodhaini]CAH8577117.1 unnamed protein product [Schistosoma rodhaini]
MLGYNNSSDFQKIGLGLLAFGVGFLCLGVLFFFDGALLALGCSLKVLFLGGIGCLIGLQKACTFFFRRTSLKGAVFFFGGITVVLFGFPFIGILLEIYGMINLFSKFIPVAIKFLYGVPVIGWILWLPGINGVSLCLKVA